mmetsp:Transcript_100605/g.260460  ORF Transcript_100605/g.260460 Transcript_100605/m.260460 type:complete len:211 (-) Transcript_100605:827-1459(-)
MGQPPPSSAPRRAIQARTRKACRFMASQRPERSTASRFTTRARRPWRLVSSPAAAACSLSQALPRTSRRRSAAHTRPWTRFASMPQATSRRASIAAVTSAAAPSSGWPRPPLRRRHRISSPLAPAACPPMRSRSPSSWTSRRQWHNSRRIGDPSSSASSRTVTRQRGSTLNGPGRPSSAMAWSSRCGRSRLRASSRRLRRRTSIGLSPGS